MDALRKFYHRAVQIPLDNVEHLWQELEAFETNLNRITAKKFMADLSPAHMQARTVLRQLVNHVGAIPPIRPKISYHRFPSLTHQSMLWSANGKLISNGKKAILWR
jgi:cleavage stimulation factor subunit 3